MDNEVHINDNTVPLIPIKQPSTNGSNVIRSSSTHNSPSLLRRPITPTPPSGSASRNESGVISLRMPNIAINRPLTSPVNIQRSSSISKNIITIPSNVADQNSIENRRSRSRLYTSPINIPSTVRLPASPQHITSIPRNEDSLSGGGTGTNESERIISGAFTGSVEIERPPILSTETSSISIVNAAVNAELSHAISQEAFPNINPLIRREDMVPIINRPLSPRDETQLSVHGLPLDRSNIIPIVPPETDTDNEEITTSDTTTNLINISGQIPNSIPSTGPESTTIDSTDGMIRNTLNGPMTSELPNVNSTEIVIRPASPTTQVNIPLSNPVTSLPSISPGPINDAIINPAPPTTTLTKNLIPSRPIQPPIASRLPISRNKHQIPSTLQPTPITSQFSLAPRQPIPNLNSEVKIHDNSRNNRSIQRQSISNNPPRSQPVVLQNKQPPTTNQQSSVNNNQHTQQSSVNNNQHTQQSSITTNQQSSVNNNQHTQQSSITTNQQSSVNNNQHTQQSSIIVEHNPSNTEQLPRARQSVPITSTAPGIRQPVPITSTVPGIRQPAPITSIAPGIRQPAPIALTTPEIRQPMPITSSASEIRQPTPIASSAPEIRQPTPVTSTAQSASNSQNTGDNKINDTQPLPSDNTLIQAPVLPPPNVPNYSAMSAEEQAQHRANFRTRFGILRNAWPNYHIPDIPDNVPLEQIHAQYDIYVRHIHISRDVDQYKVYLVIMWLVIELFCTKIGLNIGGYTVSQMRAMNKYERLLIELGETNYKASITEANSQSNWPVEIRIFFMALVNAVTFIIIKMLANYIGENMATTIIDGLSSYLSGAPPQPGQVLFGGSNQTNEQPRSQGPSPGGPPLPQMGGAFGGIDIASLLGNLGSMFIRGQAPTANNNTHQVSPGTTAVPQTPTTPRYRPAYSE